MSKVKSRQEIQPYLSVNPENVLEVASNIGYIISSLGEATAKLEELHSQAKLDREITVAEVSEDSAGAIAASTGKRPTEKQLEIACLTSDRVKAAYHAEFEAKRKWREAQNLLQDYYTVAGMCPALIGRVNANVRIENGY